MPSLYFIILKCCAGMVKLANTQDLKSCGSNPLWVQIPLPAPLYKKGILIILPMILWIIILITTPNTTETVDTNTNTNNPINTAQKETELKKEEVEKPKIEAKQQNKTENEELEKPAKEEPKQQIQPISNQNINNSISIESSSSNSNNSQGRVVYETPSGKRYHFDPNCGGLNSKQTDLESAKSSGLTPCKKCTQ